MSRFFGSKSRNALMTILGLSLVLHVVALILFGAITFINEVVREETVFQAPPVELPPQEQPEYTVNIQNRNESTQPPRPNPIVIQKPQDIDIPTLSIDIDVDGSSAFGRGRKGGFGSGQASQMRDMAIRLTDFGYDSYVDGTLEGTLFDFKYDDRLKPLVDVGSLDMNGHNQSMFDYTSALVHDFSGSSWNVKSLINKYLSSAKKLYASYIVLPNRSAAEAPRAFAASDTIKPLAMGVLYEGSFKAPDTGTFRLVGMADDFLLVRVNDRLVLDASYGGQYSNNWEDQDSWPESYFDIDTPARLGRWMNWEKGEVLDIKIFMGESPGGQFGAYLLIQKKDEDRLRIFSTKPLTEKERQYLKSLHPDCEDLF